MEQTLSDKSDGAACKEYIIIRPNKNCHVSVYFSGFIWPNLNRIKFQNKKLLCVIDDAENMYIFILNREIIVGM